MTDATSIVAPYRKLTTVDIKTGTVRKYVTEITIEDSAHGK